MGYTLHHLQEPDDARWAEALALVNAYKAFLQENICFQKPDDAVTQLQAHYRPPQGALLLALSPAGEAAGMVALQCLEAGAVAEMKRLYVLPDHAGHGLGRRLIEGIEAEALGLGYQWLKLDTLPKLRAALHLYESMGYEVAEPYYHNPLPGVIYLQKRLH